jgi:hypothetical protein
MYTHHVGRLDKDTNQTLSKSLIQVGENTQRVKKDTFSRSSRKLKQTLEVKRFIIDIGGPMGETLEGPPTPPQKHVNHTCRYSASLSDPRKTTVQM